MSCFAKIIWSAAAATVLLQSTATAIVYDFKNITNNDAPNDVAAQFSVEVSDFGTDTSGANRVLFSFFNLGLVDSTIAEIYFDDGLLLGISDILDKEDDSSTYSGVDFESVGDSVSPKDLPGGNSITPAFETTTPGFFASEAENPAPKNGVDPGEQVGIVFSLQSGAGLSDVISQLNDGTVRIGMHVISIGSDEYSDSFVNVVPEPSTYSLLAGVAVIGCALLRRRPR